MNRYSALTENFLASTSELSFFFCHVMKWIFCVKLFFPSLIILFLVPSLKANTQENRTSEFKIKTLEKTHLKIESNQVLIEDILSDTDSELGFVVDPKISKKSESNIRKGNIEESGSELRFEEDFLDSSESESETIFQKNNLEFDGVNSGSESNHFKENESGIGIQKVTLEEIKTDLGLELDSFDSDESVSEIDEVNIDKSEIDLGLESDPFDIDESASNIKEVKNEESEDDLGFESDPFDEDGSDLNLEQDHLLESSEGGEVNKSNYDFKENERSENQENMLEEEYTPKVSFSHEVKTMLGGSETKGLSVLDPLLTEIKELRLVTTYDQSVKVQTSPQMYNYFRLSVSFSQNYEIQKKRIFDGFATVREIYSNYRVGSHQIRYGTQIFNLGKVDLDKVIDVLHMNNIMGIYTFDPDDSKDAIPSIRYNWYRGEQTATLYLSPVRQQTFGMRFAEFREEVEKKEEGNEDSKVSFLRDYYGLQYQWTGDIMDTRIGMFHWFDSNPYIKLEYKKVGDNGTTLQGSFEDMLSNYNEKETRSDFLTLEIDATWTDMVWKFESGYFKKRNLYSYEIPEGKVVRLSTFSAPHFALSTSFERTFPYFYWLMLFSHRKWYDVPENTHIFLYENESYLVSKKRDLFRNQVSGVAVLKTPDNSLRITLLSYQTWPFKQKGFASLFTWERFKENMELELKYFRLETEDQKMLNDKIKTNQIFLTYSQKFKAY